MTTGHAVSTADGNALEALYQRQKAFFDTGVTLSYAFRKGQLQVLKAAIKRHEDRIIQALKQDLHKSSFEAYGTEIGLLYEEINHTAKHLKQWMQPARVTTPLMFFPSASKVYRESLGVTLIIAPWNYPFMLLIAPLISAIAGGNTCILKPSEQANATEKAVIDMIHETYEDEYIAVVSGHGEELEQHLVRRHRLGHVFFTGSTQVGKKILAAAATQLTPVTLEMGGKSPAIVAADARLDFAAKKIAWSKWINAGQTCVTSDYLLVHESVMEKFMPQLIKAFQHMMGDGPHNNSDYPHIINRQRFEVLETYLQEGRVLYGGERDAEQLFFAPTLVAYDHMQVKAMQEEIFGPVLPVFTYRDYPEAMEMIRQQPDPLAFYLFTENKKLAQSFIDRLPFGGGCINNALVHLGNPALPFGGVGSSGMGKYHGRDGFEAFTRKKSILSTPSWFDVTYWYPPFKDHLKFLRWFMK